MPIAVEGLIQCNEGDFFPISLFFLGSWQSSGDVMVISNVAGLPLSLPAMRMSAGVVWSLVMP